MHTQCRPRMEKPRVRPQLSQMSPYAICIRYHEHLNSKLTWKDYIEIAKNATDFYNKSKLSDPDPSDLHAHIFYRIHIWILHSTIICLFRQPTGGRRWSQQATTCPSFIIGCMFYDIHWQPSFDVKCNGFCQLFLGLWIFSLLHHTFERVDRSNKYVDSQLCYTSTTFLKNTVTSIAYLTSPSGRGVRVAVHNPGTMPDLKRGISIGPGTETKVEIVQTIRQRLHNTIRWKRLLLPRNIYLDLLKELYTYDACLETCTQQKIVDKCKCVSQFFQYTEEQFDHRKSHTLWKPESAGLRRRQLYEDE